MTQAIISLARLKYVFQASRLDTKVRTGIPEVEFGIHRAGGRLEMKQDLDAQS